MRIRYIFCFLLLASQLAAQSPLSAIDWLSKENSKFKSSISEVKNIDVKKTNDIQVSTLNSNEYQSIGLLPIYVTGIPSTIWRNSSFDDLEYSFKTLPTFSYSPIQELMYSLLLAEARPPLNEPSRYAFLEIRLEKLLDYGAVDPAIALIERASPVPEKMISLLFDISLLSSNNLPICEPVLQNTKNRDLQAELIYCYARKGDWLTAHLILKTEEVLGELSPQEVSLLDRYLEVDFNVDLHALLPPPETITPLEYRLYEAIGEPISAEYLPIQYSQSDLSGENGWRAQVIAAERLSSTGAIPENQILGIYTSRSSGVSGGIWERVKVVNDLDTALVAREDFEQYFQDAWKVFKQANQLTLFAKLFGLRVFDENISPKSKEIAANLLLLTNNFAITDSYWDPSDIRFGLTTGDFSKVNVSDETEKIILQIFTEPSMPFLFEQKLNQGKLGEVILNALLQFEMGIEGNLKDLSESLSTLNLIGLETTARRAALTHLVLGK
tara:strand:- start:1314 stop:2807 length:1494 start_codon:yes stop_codon:yes gene_type:complete